MDDIEREAIRDEGYDPDDPTVVAALDRVRAERAAMGFKPPRKFSQFMMRVTPQAHTLPIDEPGNVTKTRTSSDTEILGACHLRAVLIAAAAIAAASIGLGTTSECVKE
jgi:hypothetical protein